MALKPLIIGALDDARARTLELLAPLDDDQLVAQHSPLMSPLVWDAAHIANFEDLWLVRALGGEGVGHAYDDVYDAFKHPRRDRPTLALLDPPGARRYLADVRSRTLDILDHTDLGPDDALRRDGFVYGMVVQHEHQHDETMLATLQLMGPPGLRPATPGPLQAHGLPAKEVFVPAGPFVMGTSSGPWSYDNERPARIVELPAFWIDAAPVTNGDVLAFVTDGGYERQRWWSRRGWAWRVQAELDHPQFWRRNRDRAWTRNRFGWDETLPLDEPVQHVCWYEAEAYAHWAGKRLPTEAEWEKAAAWDETAGRSRRYPWGDEPPTADHANLGQHRFGPAPVGAYPHGVSATGCHQMIGDVWEWTASNFTGHPGFAAFPYPEYSEVFFGAAYKVLRGGSWATHSSAVRTTFRNWDYPIRRQIFAGFRCARDA